MAEMAPRPPLAPCPHIAEADFAAFLNNKSNLFLCALKVGWPVTCTGEFKVGEVAEGRFPRTARGLCALALPLAPLPSVGWPAGTHAMGQSRVLPVKVALDQAAPS